MNELDILKQQVSELLEWKRQKELQQISFPLDDTSKNILGVVVGEGNGATALTQVYTDSNTDTHTGPKAYVDTIILKVGAIRYEIPYIATP
jgi:hypothetical protein